jgi:hypothetical protein
MKTRSLVLTGGVLVATLGVAGCMKSANTSQNSNASTTAAASASVSIKEALTLAKAACQTFDVAVGYSNAHPNDNAYQPGLSKAAGEAEEAVKLDPQQWQNLSAALDQIKTDITSLNTLQAQNASQTQKNSASALAVQNATDFSLAT